MGFEGLHISRCGRFNGIADDGKMAAKKDVVGQSFQFVGLPASPGNTTCLGWASFAISGSLPQAEIDPQMPPTKL
jgi:hypothetical protein